MPTLLFGMCIGAAAMLVFTWYLQHAPAGYEDAAGYHDGEEVAQPCPLCWSLPTIERGHFKWSVYHECPYTQFYCEYKQLFNTEREAINAWNEALPSLTPANKPGNRTTTAKSFIIADSRDSLGSL